MRTVKKSRVRHRGRSKLIICICILFLIFHSPSMLSIFGVDVHVGIKPTVQLVVQLINIAVVVVFRHAVQNCQRFRIRKSLP